MKKYAYDYFIAVPMSSLGQGEYGQFQGELRTMVDRLATNRRKAFCAPVEAEKVNFDSPTQAYGQDKQAMIAAREFVLIMPKLVPSSALIEWGWADMLEKPTTVCFRKKDDIPFLMRDLNQTEPERVEYLVYDNLRTITTHLLSHQPRHPELRLAPDDQHEPA